MIQTFFSRLSGYSEAIVSCMDVFSVLHLYYNDILSMIRFWIGHDDYLYVNRD